MISCSSLLEYPLRQSLPTGQVFFLSAHFDEGCLCVSVYVKRTCRKGDVKLLRATRFFWNRRVRVKSRRNWIRSGKRKWRRKWKRAWNHMARNRAQFVWVAEIWEELEANFLAISLDSKNACVDIDLINICRWCKVPSPRSITWKMRLPMQVRRARQGRLLLPL